ncbi:MAG: transposase [Candidatus Nitrosopolaris sp.]
MNLVSFLSKSYIRKDVSEIYLYMLCYKFRIYPNQKQIQALEQIIESCRLLYNQSLEERRKDSGLKYNEQKRNLTQKRKNISSLQNIHSQVLQNVLLRLEKAFQNHHRNPNQWGMPMFKRHFRYNSITYPQLGGFQVVGDKLKLAFVDGLINVKLHRVTKGVMKTCTIIKDIDRWFVCFSCNDNRQKNVNGKKVGIDVGLT